MINIAIIGYGRMGRRIAELSPSRGLHVSVIIDNEAEWQQFHEQLAGCDVALEFSIPATAMKNVTRLLEMGIPVVSGTTAWDDEVAQAALVAGRKGVGLMVASNFSIGMNIFFALNRYLAEMMNRYPEYSASVEETHHIHKLDAPSGTAKALLSDMLEKLTAYETWQSASDEPDPVVIPVTSIREGEVTGIHKITYAGESDRVEIRHEALNRDGFVLGAIEAAKWLIGKAGFHTMHDMLFGNEKNVCNTD